MKKIKQYALEFWKDESAQGATEYILLLVVIVALVLMFKDKIKDAVADRIGTLENMMGQFTGD